MQLGWVLLLFLAFTAGILAIFTIDDTRQARALAEASQYEACPQEDMVKVPVNYPEGPDKCVQVDEIQNEYTVRCDLDSVYNQRVDIEFLVEEGRQFTIVSVLCEVSR